MVNMRYIEDIEDTEEVTNLKAIVTQDLKELGVKLPKIKKNHDDRPASPPPGVGYYRVFGNYLSRVPCNFIDGYGQVPSFLVEATEALDDHIHSEGLFRYSGSFSRQKDLREKIEKGEKLKRAHPDDLTGLIKYFFRELADPLFTFKLHDCFVKAYVNPETDLKRGKAILLLCLLLPCPNLSTLRYLMTFLSRVASHSEDNKMDPANLAICLAPNILHNHQKLEKISNSESKLLRIQISVVKFLISNAGDIGMVSESLLGRTQLLSSCFPSDDELEKSDENLNDKKPKKKKKRSGSLQGLVTNLSNSFSRWRRDSKGHNSSNMSEKSSMYSIMSDPTDMSVASQDTLGSPKDSCSLDVADIMLSEVTPKVMRKRKMSGELIPFSANKKKAILQQMPHMSTLGGTPFTPLTRTRSQGHEFHLETPNIKFTDEASRLIFSASQHTPRSKLDHMLLPSTTNKVKRHNSNKSSCFNQKTPKSKRRSVRGFLRRLSGGKDNQPSPANGVVDSSDVALRLADISGPPDHVTIITPGSGKRMGFFKSRKHRKTPSLPTRLVMKGGKAVAVDDLDDTCNATSTESTSMYVDSTASPMLRPRRRGYSADGTPGTAAIRRGRPNTVSVGLPVDKATGLNRSRRSMDLPPRHSSQRDIFASPERNVPLDCDAGVIDTSPILKADPYDEEMPSGGLGDEFDEDESMMDQSEMCVENVPHNQAILESEHDDAFIHELSVFADSHSNDSFKKPMSVPNRKREPTSESSDKMDVSVTSDASDTSVITVLYNGQPVPSKVPFTPNQLIRPKSCQNLQQKPDKKQMRSQLSVGSIDSGLGPEAQDTAKPIAKSCSKNSLLSTDSALGKEEEMAGQEGTQESGDRKIQREASDSVLYQKKKVQTVRRSSFEPNLQTSADVQNMLSRSGMMEQERTNKLNIPIKQSVVNLLENHAGKVAENVKHFDQNKSDEVQVAERKSSPLRFHNSVARRGNSPLRIPTIFAKADQEAAKYRDIANTSRGRTSPIPKMKPALPISTNLLRTAAESAKLKASSESLNKDVSPTRSQSLVSTSAELSQSLIETINDVCTPKSEKISKEPLKDSTNMEDLVVPMTPRIKPCMLSASVTAKFLAKGLANTPRAGSLEKAGSTLRKCRSPVKPVKRLQGSPSSPRSPHKSPTKVANRHSLSPLPTHVSDWNF